MGNGLRALIVACGALMIAAAPAIAHAERVYFLVGPRHVYRIGQYQYAHLADRQKIEQEYADQVAADQDQFNKAVESGADPAVESPELNNALEDLAVKRDQQLGSLFERVDYMRGRHPELRIEGDGPYQVIGINFHWRGPVEVFDDFVVYAPWPGYVVVGHPYGWEYGVVYNPFRFHHVYTTWYGGYVSIGRPAYVGLYGYRGAVRVVGFSRGPRGVIYSGRPHGGSFGHRGPVVRPSYGRGGGRISTHSVGHVPSRPSYSGRPSSRTNYGGSRPTSHIGGTSRPTSHTGFGGSRPTSHTSFGGSRPTSHTSMDGSGGGTRGSFGGARSSGSFGGRSTSTHTSSGGRSSPDYSR